MEKITGKTFDEERALYALTDAEVENCVFAGPADGESALKEAQRICVSDCRFSLRYPFWHTKDFTLKNSSLDELTRASVWYAEDGTISDCVINGIKCLRECSGIKLKNVNAVSPEFGWRCRNIDIADCDITSEYFMFECENVNIDKLTMKGKYSFQYTENVTVKDSYLDTKDAFWHSKNATVENSVVKGEYLAWYSENLTLINCKIIGTQPLCYCKNLTLDSCTMEDTDFAFERSSVKADVVSHIISVRNPYEGYINADSIGQVYEYDPANGCAITTKNKG